MPAQARAPNAVPLLLPRPLGLLHGPLLIQRHQLDCTLSTRRLFDGKGSQCK